MRSGRDATGARLLRPSAEMGCLGQISLTIPVLAPKDFASMSM